MEVDDEMGEGVKDSYPIENVRIQSLFDDWLSLTIEESATPDPGRGFRTTSLITNGRGVSGNRRNPLMFYYYYLDDLLSARP